MSGVFEEHKTEGAEGAGHEAREVRGPVHVEPCRPLQIMALMLTHLYQYFLVNTFLFYKTTSLKYNYLCFLQNILFLKV